MPSTIGNLTALQHLTLYENNLSGNLPSSLGNLSSLILIDASGNQFTGNLPPEMGNLANLQFLLFGENQLSGSIPPEFGNLTNLYYVWLVDNQLSGSIPPEIESWTNIWVLRLDENQLAGSIPPQIGSLTNLFELGLSENRLTGSIPLELGNLPDLERLLLQNNQLSGEIPSQIANLVLLDVTNNFTDFGYNGLYSNDPDVVAFLNEKDADWASTQTIAPVDVQVVDTGVNTVELAWTPIPYTGHGGRYQIWYSTNAGGPYTLHGNTANKFATGYTAGGLLPNTTYYFVVRTFTPAHGEQQNAITSGNSGEVSGTTEVAGLNAPSHLNVVSSSQNDTDLSWQDNSPDETAFEIERSLDGLSGWLPIATIPANQTLYTDSSLDCNTTYFYRVRAFRVGDNTHSAYTNIASATTYLCTPPAEPSNVTAAGVSLTQIDVTWTDNSVDEDSFHIERSGDGVSNWQEVGSVGMDETSYSDTGLLCNRLFFYRVRAFRAGDAQYSLYSNVASGATLLCLPPNAPAIVSAVGEGINKIAVTWQDNSLDESSFSIEMSAANQNTWSQIALVPTNQTSYTHEGLLCGTSYDFRVRAYRGDDGQYSLPSGALQGTTLGCPPPVPNTAGLYQNGGWLFRDTNSTGTPDVRFRFGPQEGGWIPLVGDWDGDGIDGIGLYKDGMWLLRNSASSGQRDLAFSFNPLGAGALPIVGDWNGDGVDTIGLYKEGMWVFRDSNSSGQRDHVFTFTPGGSGWQPLAGDWNGDYYDTVGLYKEGRWYLLDALETPQFTSSFKFGPPQVGWTAIVGDWDANGEDTIGLYRDGVWRLRNSNSEGGVDVGFSFLPGAKGWTPVAGYRGGIAGLSALGLSEELPVLPTLEILPTATSEIATPTESVTPAPEVTETLIAPTDTPTATVEAVTDTPTEISTELLPTATETPAETVVPEETQTP
jgi:Leucine-rich repeat (LRR) protein